MSSSTIGPHTVRNGALSAESWLAAPARAIARGIVWIVSCYRLRRHIAELKMLDDRMLRDIGLRRGEIEHAVRCGKVLDRINDQLG